MVIFYTTRSKKKQSTLTKKLLINISSVADVQDINSDFLLFDRIDDPVNTDPKGELTFKPVL